MDDIMDGGGGKSALGSLKPGQEVAGIIIGDPVKKPDMDEATNTQKTFKSGDLRWIWVVPIQTDQRDDADDDGVRSLWLSWKSLSAFTAAVREGWIKYGRTGKPRPEIGGFIVMHCTGSQRTGYGATETKSWAAAYTPPDAPPEVSEMMDTPTSPAAPTVSTPVSAPPQATPRAPGAAAGLRDVAQQQGNVLQRMQQEAAARRAGQLPPAPAHHAVGEPPF